MIVYKVTNSANGKIYVGATTDSLAGRKHAHFTKHKSNPTRMLFYVALHEFGWDNFVWEILEVCNTRPELMEAEKKHIKELHANDPDVGYNVAEGGDGVIYDGNNGEYEIMTPSGDIIIVKGYKRFCRDNGLNEGALHFTLFPQTRRYVKKDGSVSIYSTISSQHKGFRLLSRFNDYPGREYTQASGNGEHPGHILGDDIVCSA